MPFRSRLSSGHPFGLRAARRPTPRSRHDPKSFPPNFPQVVSAVASKFASWLYLNLPDDPAFYPEEIKSGGVKSVEVRHIPGPTPLPSEAQVAAAFESLGRLPRPLLIQCSSGNRAGALLLLWLALTECVRGGVSSGLSPSLQAGASGCIRQTFRDLRVDRVEQET